MDLPDWARRGEKVVCIDDDWRNCESPFGIYVARFPMINEILTIEDVHRTKGIWFLSFDEISEFTTDGNRLLAVWNVCSFRPLIKNSKTEVQDVEMFLPFLQTRELEKV